MDVSVSYRPRVRKLRVGWSVDGYWCPTRRVLRYEILKRERCGPR